MRINPNSQVASPQNIPGPAATQEPDIGQDDLSAATSTNLEATLQQTPDTRTDKVTNAIQQISDPTYPPMELIHKLSALLAIHITGQNLSN